MLVPTAGMGWPLRGCGRQSAVPTRGRAADSRPYGGDGVAAAGMRTAECRPYEGAGGVRRYDWVPSLSIWLRKTTKRVKRYSVTKLISMVPPWTMISFQWRVSVKYLTHRVDRGVKTQ